MRLTFALPRVVAEAVLLADATILLAVDEDFRPLSLGNSPGKVTRFVLGIAVTGGALGAFLAHLPLSLVLVVRDMYMTLRHTLDTKASKSYVKVRMHHDEEHRHGQRWYPLARSASDAIRPPC